MATNEEVKAKLQRRRREFDKERGPPASPHAPGEMRACRQSYAILASSSVGV